MIVALCREKNKCNRDAEVFMVYEQPKLYLGDCREILKGLRDNSVDLIFTSPPYADQRAHTYGGIHPDEYVEWFLPITEHLLRVMKPSGSFVLNIKEKVVGGERLLFTQQVEYTSHSE